MIVGEEGKELPFAACIKCLQVLTYSRSSGTSHLNWHKCRVTAGQISILPHAIHAKRTASKADLEKTLEKCINFVCKTVHFYKRKTERGHYGDERLRAAVDAVHRRLSLNPASNEYGIPRRTLRQHHDDIVRLPEKVHMRSTSPVFMVEYEDELVLYIHEMEKAMYGLTMTNVRRLAYDLAE
ncbi:hypothetical protein LSAT2_022427 [Lamellibrachia satsuma]|nr:hypothetical protein LSAT2_022427 [Lamellibrachia satsuma]